MLHYWWIPAVLLMYAVNSWLSIHAKDGWKFVVALFVIQCFGFWPIVARYSKNIAVDGLLFDLLTLIAFYGTLWALGSLDHFSVQQWIGFSLAVLGILLMKGTFG